MWPEMRRRSHSIDEFLWKGDRKAKPVQRAALVLYSMMFLSMAFVGFIAGWKQDYWVMRVALFATASLLTVAGVRFMRNAFR